MKKVYIETLGCAKNWVDSEQMLGYLKDIFITDDPGEAETIIVNTCGFLQSSRQESIECILELAEQKTSGRCKNLIVSGCLVESSESELRQELHEVDLFITANQAGGLVDFLSPRDNLSSQNCYDSLSQRDDKVIFSENVSQTTKPRRHYLQGSGSNYLKISEGCNQKCSFCTIPQFKGKMKSRQIDELVQEASDMASEGICEINLVAQDLSSYGVDLANTGLTDLLRALVKIKDVKWIRLLYLYPSFVDDELIKVVQNEEKIARYFDIPLQHLDNRILKAMKRSGTMEEYKDLIQKIRGEIPQVAIRTTLITGFPGETDSIFQSVMDNIKVFRFNRLGAFEYSPEESTKSFQLPNHVEAQTRKARLKELMETQAAISAELLRERVGQTCDVLIEERIPGDENNPDYYIGRSEWEAPEVDGNIVVSSIESLLPGNVYPVIIKNSSDYDLYGTVKQNITKSPVGNILPGIGLKS